MCAISHLTEKKVQNIPVAKLAFKVISIKTIQSNSLLAFGINDS